MTMVDMALARLSGLFTLFMIEGIAECRVRTEYVSGVSSQLQCCGFDALKEHVYLESSKAKTGEMAQQLKAHGGV